MGEIFKRYAEFYDIIYAKKDYGAECEFLSRIFSRYARRKVRDVLDVACGTGNHIIPLSRMGYRMHAQDVSKAMLKIAREKALKEGSKIGFMGCYPMQKFRHQKKFDAIIAMFSSIDYILKDTHLKDALLNVQNSLKKGGLFAFDFWNRDCVERYFSASRKNTYRKGEKGVIRSSRTILNKRRSIANIHYTCDYFQGGRRLGRVKELHRVKYHSPRELFSALDACGFEVLAAFPFMRMGRKITSRDWDVSVVATPK